MTLSSTSQAGGDGGGAQVCSEHVDEVLNYFCNTCKTGACHLCVLDGDGRHKQHDVHLLAVICKQQKVLYPIESRREVLIPGRLRPAESS